MGPLPGSVGRFSRVLRGRGFLLALFALSTASACSAIFSLDGYEGPPLDAGGEAGSVKDGAVDRNSMEAACPLPFTAAVLADQPIVYYPMDEAPGDMTMHDRAGGPTTYDGTYGSGVEVGTHGLLSSEPGVTSPHFAGGKYEEQNSANVPTNLALEPGSALTVEFVFEEDLVNPDPDGGDDGYIDVVHLGWSAQIMPSNTMKFFLPTIYDGKTNSADLMGGMSLVPHQVHLFDATYDGFSEIVVYLDAVAIASADPSTDQGTIDYAGAAGLQIGGAYGPNRATLRGQIAQVSLYSAQLSPTRIKAHYAATGLGGNVACPSGG